MAIIYDPDRCFATRAEVMAAAGDLDLRNSDDPEGPTKPSDDTGESFCQKVTSLIVLATENAGQRYDPPTSAIGDVAIADALADACAIGTAFRIRWSIYTRTRSQADMEACEKLLRQWEVYFGTGSAEGGKLGTSGEGGIIPSIVGAGSSVRVIASDLTRGQTALDSLSPTSIDVSPRFETRRLD